MKRKKRVSNRSLQLYLALLMQGLKKITPTASFEPHYYGIELNKNECVFIHKRRALFTIEDDGSIQEKFVISRTRITDKSMDLILEYVT